LGPSDERVMQQIQPVAAYFTAIDDKRTGLIILRPEGAIPDPVGGQALLMGVNASIDFSPAMTVDEVQAGLQEAAKAFSRSRRPGRGRRLIDPIPQQVDQLGRAQRRA
jgi:hypothetical protein